MFSTGGVAPQAASVLTEAASKLSEVKVALDTRCITCVQNRWKQITRTRSNEVKHSQEELKSSEYTSPLNELGLNHLPDNWIDLLNIPNSLWVKNARHKVSEWKTSHISAQSFFQNKTGFQPSDIYQSGHALRLFGTTRRKPKFHVPKLNIHEQRRYASRYAAKNKILHLEEMANSEPDNPHAQAEYMKAIVNEDPDYVVRRYESGRYASNEEVKMQYFKALVLKMSEKLSPSDIQTLGTALSSGQTRGSGSGSSRNTNSNFFTNSQSQGTEEQPIHVLVQSKGKFFRDQIINTIKFFIIIIVVLHALERFQTKIGTNTKEIRPDTSEKKVKFSDVQGVDEAKQELQEVVEFLRSPDRFERLGGKLPTGLLLIGPPGTGKTLLARAVAGEAGVPFFFCSGSEFDEMFVGVGAARVRNLFSTAKEHAPCIVFIDELDAIGGTRVSHDAQPYSRMTLNQLLVELDGFDKQEGIVVIGATNFPEILDKALTRPGRFDSKVTISAPDVRGRKQILDLYLDKVPCGDDVDAEVLARGTPGFTGAELQNLVNQAAVKAAVDNEPYVTIKHLDWARDKIMMGPERKSAYIEQKNRELVAFHESGHAIVALHTPDALPVHKATIIPRGPALGMVMQLPAKDQLQWSRKQLLAKLDVCMGGRVAEELIFGKDSITTGASDDMGNATNIANAMVTQYGMSEKVGTIKCDDVDKLSPTMQTLIESEVKTLIKDSYERAKNVLTTHATEHRRLAEGLLKYETLDAEEVKLVVSGHPLPRKI